MCKIKEKCTCGSKGRTVWRISPNGDCLRCGNVYLNNNKNEQQ